METLNRSVYSREENKVFNLLTITGRYKIVGSQSIPHIKYKKFLTTNSISNKKKKITF